MSLPKTMSEASIGAAFAADNGVAVQASKRQATAMSFAVFMMCVLGMVQGPAGVGTAAHCIPKAMAVSHLRLTTDPTDGLLGSLE
jgi:hypothetical protein